jgi:hypothetical protein
MSKFKCPRVTSGAPLRGICLTLGLVLMAGLFSTAQAKTSWRSLRPTASEESVCLEIQGQSFNYYLLGDDKPVVLNLRGPRRLKVVTRYLFSEDDSHEQDYELRILMDGREILSRSVTGKVLSGPRYCQGDGDVGALRKSTISIPTGQHEVQIFAVSSTTGRVAARFFRESKLEPAKEVSFAPESFEALYHLQFASGKQSSYYHFSADTPLAFTIKGPTNLKVYTRLDFDHTMNGSQAYSLELLRDGEQVNVYHYHAKKLSSAAYVERPDLLPGDRKLLRVSVPKGVHRYEIRCVRPDVCGIATMIRIPEADINLR